MKKPGRRVKHRPIRKARFTKERARDRRLEAIHARSEAGRMRSDAATLLASKFRVRA